MQRRKENNHLLTDFSSFVRQSRLHRVNETGFSFFCESSEFGNTEFELGRSWGLGYKAVLRVWVGVPSGPGCDCDNDGAVNISSVQ